ncbi:winged helix-turn-helix transcriptional regulator [Halorientalis persicus]|uniref:winged helix-turn-helix transcriptional regulator n=1 Tax=Halorientalis persicus TaxID=1367881 RepID=UPI000B81DC5A|nr:winged helix-turn-helix transcriptional regulator [Halorientalis persicus]
MGDAGLSLAQADILGAVATISLDEDTPSDAAAAVTGSDGFQDALVDGVRETLAGVPYYARQRTLEDLGVTAAEGMYAAVLTGLDRPAERVEKETFAERYPDASASAYEALHRHATALEVTQQFGQPEPSIVGHLSLDALAEGPVPVIGASGQTPTIAVTVDRDAFEGRDRDDQEQLLELVVTLADACDVRVVSKPVTARWLTREFRDILPSEFRESVRAQCGGSPTADLVDAAREALSPDGRQVDVLRELAATADDIMDLHALQNSVEVSDGRVSQILGQLEELGLAERYGKQTAKRVELLQPGVAFLDALDADVGQQATLESAFSAETGTSTESQPDMCTIGAGPGPGDVQADADSHGGTGWLTSFMHRRRQAPAIEAATEGGLTLLDAPVDDIPPQKRLWCFDEDSRDLVVGARITSRLSYLVSTALALADPRTWNEVLPTSAVDAGSPFGGLAIDDRNLLRDGRQLGYLSDDVDDSEEWRDKILEWRKDLAEWTGELRTGDGGEGLGSRIFRNAKGLIGVMTHVLDLAGVGVTVLGIVPNVKRDFGKQAAEGEKSQREKLAETIVGQASIDAAYGSHTLERTVFEKRERKVQSAMEPNYDAADPLADLVADTVLVGPGVSILEPLVEDAINDREPRDDAPEIAVRVPIRTECRREVWSATVQRMCRAKNLKPQREVTTLLRALTASPFSAARALDYLQPEDSERQIRLDEVRYVLTQLPTEHILPGMAPSVGKLATALLEAQETLSKRDLAEAADVSTRTVSRHIEKLVALGLVTADGGTYRIALPFHGEHYSDLAPDAVDAERANPQELLFEVALEFVDAAKAGRLGDPDDPLGQAFCGPRLDTDPLLEVRPALEPWVDLALWLCDADAAPETTVADYGAEIEQASILAAMSDSSENVSTI